MTESIQRDILRPAGVIFQLAVTPSRTQLEIPDGGIGQFPRGAFELVGEGQLEFYGLFPVATCQNQSRG